MDRNNLKGENATETAGTGHSAGIGRRQGEIKQGQNRENRGMRQQEHRQ
jgi:hypothetical protein